MAMDKTVFARRRESLNKMMGEGSVAIVPSAAQLIRNRDAQFAFRQDSDFQYLTGFGEPEALAVLMPGRENGEFVLFCRERDPQRELWDGYRAGLEGAVADFGADDAFPIEDADEILPGLLEGAERIYAPMGQDAEFDQAVMGWVNHLRQQARAGAHAPSEFVAIEHLLHEMRLFKSAAEQALMRKAAKVTVAAHKRAMRVCKPGMMEYALEAEYWYEFRRNGCVEAYQSIVGGGNNACILHYVDNNQELKDGDMVLVDAGAEWDCYAADVTRCFPINGRFSGPQKAVYELVLEAQLAAIDAAVLGNDWNAPHLAAVKVLTQGLVDLGLLQGERDALIEEGAFRRFYMHRTGHWLGMDVHDVGDYKVDGKWRELEAGMVLTAEPGLYIARGSEGVDERFQGIGVRIEDDVLVTRKGPDVLTRDCPKTVADIEALMKG